MALASGRCISSTSLASATRKSSELTLWLQVAVFTNIFRENRGRRNNATLRFGDTPCKKGRVALLRRSLFWATHFSRHIPPRSGLPLHGQCSPRWCVARSLTRFVAERLRCCGVYGSLSSFRRTQRTPRRHAQPSPRPTRRSPVTRSST